MRGDFLWLRPVRPHVCPLLHGGRGPHARAVRGRYISYTKVKALPESLGQCKLLETLCVARPAAAAAVRVRGGAGPALLREALPRRVPGRTSRRWKRRRRRRCRSSAAAEPRARMAGVRGRPARGRGGPEPPGAAARLARRDAGNSELAALPAAADWPNLKYL
jgi:hypothetical protein